MVALAENVRMREGRAETRKGIRKLPAVNQHGAKFPLEFPIEWNAVVGYGTPVHGVGTFSDPRTGGQDWVMVAAENRVYAVLANNAPKVVPVPAKVEGTVSFTQAFNKLLMFRGEDQEPWVLDSISEGFKEIEQEANEVSGDGTENPDDGTEPIPNGTHGVFMQNRVFIPHDEDFVSVSDYLNYTRYLPVRSQFKINQGSNDDLVALKPVGNKQLLALKDRSVAVISHITYDLKGARLDVLSNEIGCVARRSVVDVGDIWFLSERGVESLGRLQQGDGVASRTVPMSWPIEPLIHRINWEHVNKAAAAHWDNKFYLAVPLDGATENSSVFVYDFRTGQWVSHDHTVQAKEWVKAPYAGQIRLFFMDPDGYLNLYEHGFDDEVLSSGSISRQWITAKVRTRGYTLGDTREKRFVPAEMALRTWGPKYTVRAVTEGISESTTVKENVTRSRTKYHKPAWRAAWNEDNSNDDHTEPYREDYSVLVGDGVFLHSGMSPDAHQESIEAMRLNATRGRYVQLELENAEGRIELASASVHGGRGRRRYGVKV